MVPKRPNSEDLRERSPNPRRSKAPARHRGSTALRQLAIDGPGRVELGLDMRLPPGGNSVPLVDRTGQAVDPLEEVAGVILCGDWPAGHVQVDGAGVREQ